MGMLKAAVIGCGAVARVSHLPWYKMNPDVELVALADPAAESLKFCATKYDVKHLYTDVSEMLRKEKPDLVSICSPPHLHRDHVVMAAESGANVLCEKPMARTLEECDAMIAAARRHKVKFMVGFHKRFNLGLAKVKQIIDDAEIGRPHYAFIHWTHFSDPAYGGFRTKLITGGGDFQDHGSHYSDLFRWWIGDIKSVMGEINMIMPENREVEDQGVATLVFAQGAIGTIEVNAAGPEDQRGIREKGGVYGTEGAFDFYVPPWDHFESPEIRMWRRRSNEWIDVSVPCDMAGLTHYQYKRESDYFIRCVKEDTAPKPSGEDGKAAIEVILALYESWRTGKRIALPLTSTPSVKEILTGLRSQRLGK